MNRLERIATQRMMAREVIGKLKAITELFGVDDEHMSYADSVEFYEWSKKVEEFDEWIFGESPLA